MPPTPRRRDTRPPPHWDFPRPTAADGAGGSANSCWSHHRRARRRLARTGFFAVRSTARHTPRATFRRTRDSARSGTSVTTSCVGEKTARRCERWRHVQGCCETARVPFLAGLGGQPINQPTLSGGATNRLWPARRGPARGWSARRERGDRVVWWPGGGWSLQRAKTRAPVAQGIEHRFPKPCAKVRILPGAPQSSWSELEFVSYFGRSPCRIAAIEGGEDDRLEDRRTWRIVRNGRF